MLQRLGVPVERILPSETADGRIDPVDVGETTIKLEGLQFHTPVIFAEDNEPSLLPDRPAPRLTKIAIRPAPAVPAQNGLRNWACVNQMRHQLLEIQRFKFPMRSQQRFNRFFQTDCALSHRGRIRYANQPLANT